MTRSSSAGTAAQIALLPDAGPLITLAYADALDLLFKPGWTVQFVDMVLHEVMRHAAPTSQRIGDWVRRRNVPVLPTRTFEYHTRTAAKTPNLGELAIQEVMNELALSSPPVLGVFLFEDHKIARASFLLPHNCRKVSTRAFLIFLEEQGFIPSAAEVQAAASRAGRAFSRLRFPPA